MVFLSLVPCRIAPSNAFLPDDEGGGLEEEDLDDDDAGEGQAKLNSAANAALDDDDDSDEDYNPDYEETAGEFALYDSPLENIDELISIK